MQSGVIGKFRFLSMTGEFGLKIQTSDIFDAQTKNLNTQPKIVLNLYYSK
jgi:hypothetical protein